LLRPYYFHTKGQRLAFGRKIAAKALVAEAGTLTPAELTVMHVASAHASIIQSAYASTSKYVAIAGLKELVGHLVASGAPHGLVKCIPRPARPAPRPDTVTTDQLALQLSHAKPHMQLFILLCHDCALRADTASKVAWSHISGDRLSLTIRTKRQTVVKLPISGRIHALLELCPAGDLPLVSLLFGRHLGYNALYRQHKELLQSAGLPSTLWLHDLRRTMAEQTYALTSDLRVVQTLLGHDNLGSTLHYLQRQANTSFDALATSIETITATAERFPE
jgi:integrase